PSRRCSRSATCEPRPAGAVHAKKLSQGTAFFASVRAAVRPQSARGSGRHGAGADVLLAGRGHALLEPGHALLAAVLAGAGVRLGDVAVRAAAAVAVLAARDRLGVGAEQAV